MNPQIAKLAVQFLDRATLQGAEVDAFMAVRHSLMQLANPEPEPAPEPAPEHDQGG